MDWLWKSKTPSAPASASETPSLSPSIQETSVLNPAPPTPPAAQPVNRALSRDEESNQELIAFLKDLQAQSEAEQAQKDVSTASPAVPLPTDISPDSLYPTELSCRSAFDYAMFCQSFGGQFVNIYRYGSFRSCSNHWEDFWLCMRTRNWKKEDRERAIQEHYRTKAVQWKTGPSSEDVWEVRREPVKEPFSASLHELEAQIAEWRKSNPGVPDPWTPQRQR